MIGKMVDYFELMEISDKIDSLLRTAQKEQGEIVRTERKKEEKHNVE